MGGAQPLDAAHGVGADGVGGVVQDEAGEQRPVGAGERGLGELGQHQPGDDPGRLGVAALRQVDADPHGVLDGPQGEGPPGAVRGRRGGGGLAGRVGGCLPPGGGAVGTEDVCEGGPVQEGDPLREQHRDVVPALCLPGPRVEVPQLGRVAGDGGAQRGEGAGGAAEEFPQLRYAGEVAVRGAVRPDELGQGGGGAAGVREEVAGQGFGEEPGRVVGLLGAAVQVEVVPGLGVSDGDDRVEGVVGGEAGAPGGHGDDGGAAREGLEAQGLGDGSGEPFGLARPGGADGEQGGAEQLGFEGDAGGAAGVGVAGWSAAVPMRTCPVTRSWVAVRVGRSRRPEGWAQAAAPCARTASVKAARRAGWVRTPSQARRMRA